MGSVLNFQAFKYVSKKRALVLKIRQIGIWSTTRSNDIIIITNLKAM